MRPALCTISLTPGSFKNDTGLQDLDNFMVDTQYANESRDAIRIVYSVRFGQDFPVDILDIVGRTKRRLDG